MCEREIWNQGHIEYHLFGPDDMDWLFWVTAFLNFDSAQCQSLASSSAVKYFGQVLRQRQNGSTILLLNKFHLIAFTTIDTQNTKNGWKCMQQIFTEIDRDLVTW